MPIERYNVYDSLEGVPSAHCSFLQHLSDGNMIVGFFAGSYEKARDVKIYMSVLNARFLKSGVLPRWTKPIPIAFHENHSSGSPVFYETPDHKLHLFWLKMHHGRIIKGGWSVCSIMHSISYDMGKTWTELGYFRRMWFIVPRNRPLVKKDGSFIMPVHRELGRYVSLFYHNTNAYLTGSWSLGGKISVRGTGLLEPCLVELSDGTLLCFMRAAGRVKRIHMSSSSNGGFDWSRPQPIGLPNPNSQVDAVIDPDGRILLIFNNQTRGRTNLSIAVSEDEGKSWKVALCLHNHSERTAHYPSSVITSDRILHITFTDNRERIGYFRISIDEIIP